MLPCTALDSFNQCKGFSFFMLLFFELRVRDKPRPLAMLKALNGGPGGGPPPVFSTPLTKGTGGGGAEGTGGEFFTVASDCLAMIGAGGGVGGVVGGTLGPIACPE